MRLIRIFILCLGPWCISPAVAQEASDILMPPGIVVLKYKWAKATPSVSAPPPYFSGSTPVDRNSPLSPAPSTFPTGRRTTLYLYSMEISNGSSKAIKAISWDYIFKDPDSNGEMGRHSFVSFEKIATNSRKTLQIRSLSPPARVVTTSGLAKDERSPFDETVAIMCVWYKDDTVWGHPEAKGTACEGLRRWLIRRKKLKA